MNLLNFTISSALVEAIKPNFVMDKFNRRPVRNRRRRSWSPSLSHRPVKRLFTPEIKRMLKQWLVQRRENPYPSREEKKILASTTGLTFVQICNWFANWRRKLKNSGSEANNKGSWNQLIQSYNENAKGNVEQLPFLCENDSCSEETESEERIILDTPVDKVIFNEFEIKTESKDDFRKYKRSMMEKYLKDNINGELMKWIESTANFMPNKNNYVDWPSPDHTRRFIKKELTNSSLQKEELDAAEALARLSCNSTNSSVK